MMKRVRILGLLLCCLGSVAAPGLASDAAPRPTDPAAPRASSESPTAWQWYQEVPLPDGKEPPRWVDFIVPLSVFAHARSDLGDLRLFDGKDREVPYALQIREARDEQVQLPAREFNQGTGPDRSAEVSLDLGEAPQENNEISLGVNAQNIRRRVQLQGSSDAKDWSDLKLDQDYLIHFQVGAQTVTLNHFRYPPSRYRYLRLRLFPDVGLPNDRPELDAVKVWRTVRVPGEDVTWPAHLGERQPERGDDGPGSAWMIDLGGPAPCRRLTFTIGDPEFRRSYRLEIPGTEDEDAILRSNQLLTRGVWERRRGEKVQPAEIVLPSEVMVRRLRLVVTDNRNPPLDVTAVSFTAPARAVIFSPTAELTAPLRLYFGDPRAQQPQYDFAALLPARLEPPPQRVILGPLEANPTYQAPPKPLSERWPWLVYVVLGAASAVLLAILAALGRSAIARHDQLIRPRG